MNRNKSTSVLLIFLIFISIFSMNVNADSDDSINDENSMYSINGHSKFIIHDDIFPNSQFNSTWELSITLSDQIGTELLDNPELGLRAQIDIHLGNSDGLIDLNESISFDNLFRLGRNWTNSEIGGCCIFDYNPLYTVNGINLETNPVSLGPIESNNTEWGWNESAELIGLSDNRITRILDFPRFDPVIDCVFRFWRSDGYLTFAYL